MQGLEFKAYAGENPHNSYFLFLDGYYIGSVHMKKAVAISARNLSDDQVKQVNQAVQEYFKVTETAVGVAPTIPEEDSTQGIDFYEPDESDPSG